jgi:hypothetical protein
LLALLVEDTGLLNLAELPFAREIGRYSATERKLDSPRLLRTIRARSVEIRECIGRLNEELRIEVAFKVVRGHFLPAALAEIDPIDILLLARSLDAARWSGKPGGADLESPPIWTIYDDSPGARRALSLAAEFAAEQQARLCIAVITADQARFKALCKQARTLCASSLPLHFISAPHGADTDLLRRIGQVGCRLLIVQREDEEAVLSLARAASYPVAWV